MPVRLPSDGTHTTHHAGAWSPASRRDLYSARSAQISSLLRGRLPRLLHGGLGDRAPARWEVFRFILQALRLAQPGEKPIGPRQPGILDVPGENHRGGSSDDRIAIGEAEETGVETVVAIVSHDEIFSGRDDERIEAAMRSVDARH